VVVHLERQLEACQLPGNGGAASLRPNADAEMQRLQRLIEELESSSSEDDIWG
jgi:hypothetical protein